MVASEEKIKHFLSNPGKLIIMGASSKKDKAGYYVPEYLQSKGFEILPLNPFMDEFLGNETYDDLEDLENSGINFEDTVGIVIYRSMPAAEKIALNAMEKGIPMIWLPEGVTSEKAEKEVEAKGLSFVQNKCPMQEHKALFK